MYISKVSRMMDDYITIRLKNPDLPSTHREEALWVRSAREWLAKWAPDGTMDKLTQKWGSRSGGYPLVIFVHSLQWDQLKASLNRVESDNLPDEHQLYLCVRLLRYCIVDSGNRHFTTSANMDYSE